MSTHYKIIKISRLSKQTVHQAGTNFTHNSSNTVYKVYFFNCDCMGKSETIASSKFSPASLSFDHPFHVSKKPVVSLL